jgi:biotin transport system ATP-binding protein
VVVTHDLEKILAHADRLVIVNKGRIVRDGKPGEIIDEVEEFEIRKPYGKQRRVETMTWLS